MERKWGGSNQSTLRRPHAPTLLCSGLRRARSPPVASRGERPATARSRGKAEVCGPLEPPRHARRAPSGQRAAQPRARPQGNPGDRGGRMRGRVTSGRCSGGGLEDGCALWLGAARQLATKNSEDGGALPGFSWRPERREPITVRPFHAAGSLSSRAGQRGGLGDCGVWGSRAGGPQRCLVLGFLLSRRRRRWWRGCGGRCRRLPGHVVDAGRD